ncbi:MAG: FKBP-type peptidyl-prolyl cis-trans isomerase [Bacteroidota bacterium]
MKLLYSISLFALIAVFTHACNLNNDSDYKKTKSGLLYKFHHQEDGDNAEVGDFITFELVYQDENDSILMDTRETGYPTLLQLIGSEYEGDIYEGLSMMSVGDSATFVLDADDFFKITAKIDEEYDFIEPDSKLYVDVEMLKIQNQEEFEQEQSEMMKKQEEENDRLFQEEQTILNEYLDEKNIKVTPQTSGLIYIETEKGKGPQVKAGQEVTVHYTGMFLDGTVFDSSVEAGEPISFTVGRQQVISGWDEGLLLMNVGGKARLIIPSFLAYGDRGAGDVIPPFTTLVFDVEVIDAK